MPKYIDEKGYATHVMICHKCSGVLTQVVPHGSYCKLPPDHGLHGCGCMSGWVREWQTPKTIAEALEQQAKTKEYYRKLRVEQEQAASK